MHPTSAGPDLQCPSVGLTLGACSLTAREARPLAPALEDALSASEQFVFVSMGASAVPEPELLQGLFTPLAQLQNMTVVWKLSQIDQQLLRDMGLELPPHIHPVPFAPQQACSLSLQ